MRRQLAVVFAAVAAMITLAFVVPLAVAVRRTAHDRALDRARAATAQLVPVIATGTPEAVASTLNRIAAENGQQITVYLDGAVLGAQLSADDDVVDAIERRLTNVSDAAGGKVLVTAVALSGGRTAAIRVAVPDGQLNRGVVRAWLVLAALAAVLIGLAVAIADRIAARLLVPIVRLATAARQLGAGDLATRVEPSGPSELQDTAHAFNRLASDVSSSIRRERNMIAELAHRLRTPLTLMRLNADRLGASEVSADVDAVNEILSEFIRTKRAAADSLGRCDAATVIQDSATFWSALARDERRPMHVEITSQPTPVDVTGDELEAAVNVLFDNVFTHTPDGTMLRVVVTRSDDSCLISISDAGPGFDASDEASSGPPSTGLGLTIVRRFADRAAGHFDLATDDAGTTATLRLPLTGH